MSKHKPALPERLYYRLADAAQLLGCSADDLLHYGGCGYLEICASADDLFAQGIDWDELAGEDKGDGKGEIVSFPASRVFRWFDLFALSARQIGGIEKFSECKCSSSVALYRLTDGMLLPVTIDGGVAQAGAPSSTVESILPNSYFDISASPPAHGQLFGEPIKVTASDLWVRADELRRFQKEGSSHVRSDPEPPLNFKKPHGNAENNARNREAVLKAAIAVKANFPDQCKTIRDWATAIDEKARLFWPDGEPPLKPDTIERLLGDCMKLPDGK